MERETPATPGELSIEERKALDYFASMNGRTWKAELRHYWMHGFPSDVNTGILQRLRNASYFGPSGLIRYRAQRLGVVTRRTTI